MFYQLLQTSIRFRTKSIPYNCFYIRTWLIPRSIINGKVHDDYFRDLIDDCESIKITFIYTLYLHYGMLCSL